jgi:hypothetical protein
LPLHRRIGAYTALARTKKVGETCIARFTPPTSRRGITEQWESSLPLQRLLGVDSILQAESAPCGEPVRCGIQEPLRCWNPRHAHIPAVMQTTGQTTEPAHGEFVGTNHLLARLVLRQVRPRDCAAAAAKQLGSSHNRNPGLVSVPPDAGSSSTLRSRRSVTAAPAASPDPLPASIETLFSELARRRLGRLAAKERPS